MKILWLDINSSYSHSSLAIPALDAQLKEEVRAKNQWHIVSGTLKLDESWFTQRILDFSPNIILSTLWLFNHNLTMEVLSKAHALNPSVRIFLGGPQFLGENHTFLSNHKFVEAVFRGEGEDIFNTFIDKINESSSYTAIEGFCSLDKNGRYLDRGEAQVQSFTTLNTPESSLFFAWEKPFVQLETSRGCFNRCAFCISGNYRKVEELEIDRIEERIEHIYSKGVGEIRILDRTFNANLPRAVELIKLFSKYGGKIEFHLEIHPSLFNEELKRAIKEAPSGTLHMEAGIQSLNPKVLESCNRYDKREKTLDGIEYLSSLGAHQVHTDLIAGLPYYSYKNLLEDLKEIVSIGPNEIQLESLKLLPGTQLRRESQKFGIKFSTLPPYEVLETPYITYEELQKANYLSIMLDIYYNNPEWSDLFRNITLRNLEFIDRFTNYFYSKDIGKSMNREKKGLLLWNFCNKNYPKESESIAVRWMELGLSFKIGPGKESKTWKYNDTLTNPIHTPSNRDSSYKYLQFKDKKIWFLYNRKSNSSKSLLNYIEIF